MAAKRRKSTVVEDYSRLLGRAAPLADLTAALARAARNQLAGSPPRWLSLQVVRDANASDKAFRRAARSMRLSLQTFEHAFELYGEVQSDVDEFREDTLRALATLREVFDFAEHMGALSARQQIIQHVCARSGRPDDECLPTWGQLALVAIGLGVVPRHAGRPVHDMSFRNVVAASERAMRKSYLDVSRKGVPLVPVV